MQRSTSETVSTDRLIQIAQEFNAAWNAGNPDEILSFFTPDAVVRIIPPPPPPDREEFNGRDEIRAWVERTLELPFSVDASNYRAAGAIVTWDAVFPREGDDAAPDVSEVVFRGELITDFSP